MSRIPAPYRPPRADLPAHPVEAVRRRTTGHPRSARPGPATGSPARYLPALRRAPVGILQVSTRRRGSEATDRGGPWRRIRKAVASSVSQRPAGWVLAAFLLFFILLLLPIPLSGSIIGSVDSQFVPAFANTYLDRLAGAFLGRSPGQAMYPADLIGYGEGMFGAAGLFMLFRIAGIDNTFAQYLTQVAQLALMAWAMFLLAREFTHHWIPAVFAGFALTTSNFLWSDIDHLMVQFYFLPLTCLLLLVRSAKRRNPRMLMLAGVLGGLQMYVSVQVFVYQTLMVAVVLLFELRPLWRTYTFKEKAAFAAGYVLVPLPLFLFYLNTVVNRGVVDPFPRAAFEQWYSLQPQDFLSALPGKLIRYPFVGLTQGGWFRVAHSAFIGLTIPLLALIGVAFTSGRPRFAFVLIAVIGLLFALGNTLEIAETEVVSPLRLFYQVVPLSKYLRVGLRSYTMAVLGICLLAGVGLDRIAARLGPSRRLLAGSVFLGAFLLVAAENVSWPLNPYEVIPYPAVPDGYLEFFEDKPGTLILDLPSHSTTWPWYIDEIVYLIWQTDHERNILGGVSGYYPLSRIETQNYTDLLPAEEGARYLKRLGVTHVIWHDSPFLVCHPPHSPLGCDPTTGLRSQGFADAYSWLDTVPFLRLVYHDDQIKVYELVYDQIG